MKKTISLLGATGMIGSAVRTELEKKFTIKTLGRSGCNDVALDLMKPDDITPDMFRGSDILVHCAGVVDEDFKTSSLPGFMKGTYTAKKLAEAAYEAGVREFVYISSAHIYGPLTGQISEKSMPNPISDYGIAHYATEQIFRRVVMRDEKARLQILRPCATYGVPQDFNKFQRWTLIPFLFPKKATTDGQIQLSPGSDQVTRNFMSAKGIGLHIVYFLSGNMKTQTINPVGPFNASVLAFAKLSAKIYEKTTGRECKVTMTPGSSSHPIALNYTSIHPQQFEGENIEDFLSEMLALMNLSKEQAAA